MTLVQRLEVATRSENSDKYSLNSHTLSQHSSPTSSSLLTCDSRPRSGAYSSSNQYEELGVSTFIGDRLRSSTTTSSEDVPLAPIVSRNHSASICNNLLTGTGSTCPLSIEDDSVVAGATTSRKVLTALHQHQHQHQRHSLQPNSPFSPSDSLQVASEQDHHHQIKQRRQSRTEHRKSLSDLGYGKVESYARLQRLGKGTYATVYLGRSRLSNDLVALKEIHKEHDEGAPCTAIREISLLRLLRHNNIVTLHDICHTPKKLTLVFEYVGPDLYTYMRDNGKLISINNIRMLRGLEFCHARQVLHRDLKPQNLLINARGELKICDFGLARAQSIPTKSYSNEVVTLWYRPPDVLLGNTHYNYSIDMWGIGCIFYEMVSGRTFLPGSSVRQQLYLIFSNLGSPNKYNWPEMLSNPSYKEYNFPNFRPEKLSSRLPRLDNDGLMLLNKFIRFRPSERISAQDAMRESFFASLPESVHHLCPKESIFDVPGIYMTANPGQRLQHM